MNNNKLSPAQLGQLIPLVPTLIHWLRHCDKSAGNLFLQDGTNKHVEVNQSLREMLNALNYHGDLLSMVQIRYLCSSHDAPIWSAAIRLILTNSEPKLVSEEIGRSLTGSLSQLDGAKDAADCCKILGPYIDQLPRSHFTALGEFCALLRDTSDDAASLACLVGPLLLTPGVSQGKRYPQHQTAAAAAVMDLLIEECEPIFGRVAGHSKSDAFGIRKQPNGAPDKPSRRQQRMKPPTPPRPMAPPPGLGHQQRRRVSNANFGGSNNTSTANARMAKRKQQLRAFYQWRDPKRAEKVDMLLDNHNFADIAKAIHRKYSMLPPGWRVDLEEYQREKGIKLDWFVQATKQAANGKGRPISFVPPVQQPTPEPEKSSEDNAMDNVINEIADTEQIYHDKLSDLLEGFVKELRVICSGQKGKAAIEGLGLTAAEVEQIFGWRLDEIINVSNNLLTKLEVVTLVRTEPKTGEGRLGLVAEAFIEIAPELHVYAPYVSSHKASINALNAAMKKLEKGGNGISTRKLLGGKGDNPSFKKLWEKHSSQNPHLRGQSLQSLLILPIQRVPRYKLLLRELHKNMPRNHKSEPLMKQATELIEAAAKQINEALRQHEKLGKIFGEDEMINPVMSKSKTGGEGKLAIRNQYVSEV